MNGRAPAGEVILGYVRESVDVIVGREADVRDDAPDAVHAVRSASRRLASTLRTFRPLLDRQRTDPLREELRWFASVLGEARDAEVARVAVRTVLQDDDDGTRTRLDHDLGERHRSAHTAVVRALDGPRYERLHAELRSLAAKPPLTPRAGLPADRELPRLVLKADRRMRRRYRAAEQATSSTERAALLHEVRKAVKRARYAAEAAEPATGADAYRYAKRLKALQEVLGARQDDVMLGTLLEDLPEVRRTDEVTIGRLRARLAERVAAPQDALDEAWHRATRKKRRRWLRPPSQ